MNNEIARLSAYSKKEAKYKGPMKEHPVFMRAKQIQEALQYYITEGEQLEQELDAACDSLNYSVSQSGLENQEIVSTGESRFIRVPERNVDALTGEFSITSMDNPITADDDHDQLEDDVANTPTANKTIPRIRQVTGDFVGFGFNIIHVGTPENLDTPAFTNKTLFTGEIVLQQVAGYVKSSLGRAAYYTTSVIGETVIEFTKDERCNKLSSAKTEVNRLLALQHMEHRIIALEDSITDDTTDTPQGIRQLCDVAHNILNDNTTGEPQTDKTINAILDYIKYSMKLDTETEICTDTVYIKPSDTLPYINIVHKNSMASIRVENAELVCIPDVSTVKGETHSLRIYISDIIDYNDTPIAGYIPLQNVIALDSIKF